MVDYSELLNKIFWKGREIQLMSIVLQASDQTLTLGRLDNIISDLDQAVSDLNLIREEWKLKR